MVFFNGYISSSFFPHGKYLRAPSSVHFCFHFLPCLLVLPFYMQTILNCSLVSNLNTFYRWKLQNKFSLNVRKWGRATCFYYRSSTPPFQGILLSNQQIREFITTLTENLKKNKLVELDGILLFVRFVADRYVCLINGKSLIFLLLSSGKCFERTWTFELWFQKCYSQLSI